MKFIELNRCGNSRAVVNTSAITCMVEYDDFTAVHIGGMVLEVSETVEQILKMMND